MDQEMAAPATGLAASKWPRAQRGREANPFKLPRPRLSGPQTRGYEEIPEDARDFIDGIIGFHAMDAVMARRLWLDTARHGKAMRLSWVGRRSLLEPAQLWRHTFVRYALDHIVVRAGGVLVLESPFSDPLELYAYRLTVEPGARVETRGASPVRLVVGQLVGSPDAEVAPAEILVAGEDGRPGLSGGPGQCGDRHFSTSIEGPPRGGSGGGGGHGGPATNGQSLREFILTVHTLTGHTHLTVRPGAGGDGGPGGPGGCGAMGGAMALFRMADGGDGGAGGNGGDGGAGGNGSEVRLDIRVRQPGADLSVTAESGRGGAGGAGGAGGRAGIGCPDGKPGEDGCDGNRGADGAMPELRWI